MSDETKKTNALRDQKFFDTYLRGKVLDIGCGDDKVTDEAQGFDLADGDAQEISSYLKAASYDCVYSSHCLEHMRDVPAALAQWWSLVKPGGYMIVIVPDEDLYEQGIWPSIFNGDHKATFRLTSEKPSWSPVSYDIDQLVRTLEKVEIIKIETHNSGYDLALRGVKFNKFARKMFNWSVKANSGLKRALGAHVMRHHASLLRRYCVSETGYPVDQTRGDALAQIQVILRKQA